MPKKKGLTNEQKLINALRKLPNPIEDKRHGILIGFENDRARSNETRLEHIVRPRHELKPNDILRIPKGIKTSILKADGDRKFSYSLYIKRNNYSNDCIKLSLEMNPNNRHETTVKTIFITKNVK